MGWVFFAIALFMRLRAGSDVPHLNLLLIPIGLAVFFLPEHLAELNQGHGLRQKLLWILVLAGSIVLAAEIYKAAA